ncbi:hypothetical protein [Streptomyces sp. NPDC018031]|uniref:hypothetical protein n=1 Tax=Streptomyces sp. NPDC018031 TaxID=3365033 RepID=UPI00378E4D7E
MAQDPVQAAPNVYRVLFENDRVRLLEARMSPGTDAAMHRHPDYLMYSLSDGRVTFSSPSGERAEVELRTGEVTWRDTEEHATENTGGTAVAALLFEFK